MSREGRRSGPRTAPSGREPAMNQADMVHQLLQALRDHRVYPPARLSPFTERAYADAEALLNRQRTTKEDAA